ncbi:hypothetical protein C1H46_022016 [Malus baccata]|uniref:Uncharacterized protein n=1 Tax=Malus baccata TaxID=106549 RepID=A0A540M129_MALBA|nr:hypothetical protein C1H46_022016 [Malus baccata]
MASILGLEFTKSGELSFSPANEGGRVREPVVDRRQKTRRIRSESAYSSRERLARCRPPPPPAHRLHAFSGFGFSI